MKRNKIKYFLVFLSLSLIVLIITGSKFKVSSNQNYFEITKNLRILASVYEKVNNLYVDEPIPGELMKTSIDAMLQMLDPYTIYIPESNIEDLRFITTGQYGGIGATIKKIGDDIVITEPYENSPAHLSGLKAGDILKQVDGQYIEGRTIDELSNMLKGASESMVKIQFNRKGQLKEIEFKRKKIVIPAVPFFGMLNDKIGYIKLISFTDQSSEEVHKALEELKLQNNMKEVILDLRGNGGGLLGEAVDIVNFFVPKGQTVVETKGRIEEINRTYKTKNNSFDLEMPVVVLIDSYSASASEIVAGTLQDLDRGVIIGMRSFGKGLVQQTKDLKFGSKIKLTVAKYYTPSGRCIQKLDYTNKNIAGYADVIADSLIQTFFTKNGREVKDARGVDPDIVIDPGYYSKLLEILIYEDYIFNFVNIYIDSIKPVASPSEFSLTEIDFLAFKKYLQKMHIEYTTDCEDALNDLIKIAEREKYYESSSHSLEELKIKLKPNLLDDVNRYKDEIIDFLENEIVSRQFFHKGRIEVSLKEDPYVLEAKKIFNDVQQYKKILKITEN